jgi:ribosomal protein S27AE
MSKYREALNELLVDEAKDIGKSTSQLLREEYELQHKYCPVCGHDSGMVTLAGYTFDPSNMESFKDLNDYTCSKCGDTHKVHDRVGDSVND